MNLDVEAVLPAKQNAIDAPALATPNGTKSVTTSEHEDSVDSSGLVLKGRRVEHDTEIIERAEQHEGVESETDEQDEVEETDEKDQASQTVLVVTPDAQAEPEPEPDLPLYVMMQFTPCTGMAHPTDAEMKEHKEWAQVFTIPEKEGFVQVSCSHHKDSSRWNYEFAGELAKLEQVYQRLMTDLAQPSIAEFLQSKLEHIRIPWRHGYQSKGEKVLEYVPNGVPMFRVRTPKVVQERVPEDALRYLETCLPNL